MTRGKKIGIGVAVFVGLVAAGGIASRRFQNRGPEVRLEQVSKKDLVAFVTASGNVRPRRTVDMSSDVSARVTQLLVREGDDVKVGQVLLRLDPTQFQAALSRARAALSQFPGFHHSLLKGLAKS